MNAKASAKIEIMQAGVADLDVVVPLFDAYLQFYKLPPNEDAARRFLHARLLNEEAVVFLAMEEAGGRDRAALGFTLLYPLWSSLSQRRFWQLNDLFVVPEARKRGVAQALMERARRLAEETCASGLGLETAKDNVPAQKLYEQLGWKREEEFFRYELHI